MLFCTSACLACGAWFVGFTRLPLHLIADSLVPLADNVKTSDVVVPDRVLLDRSDEFSSSHRYALHFDADYPHWQMIPELKRYYIMQLSYWCQQLIVLLLGLEKPRKDYLELVAHHFVTLWLIG
jgi:hypothetical protein